MGMDDASRKSLLRQSARTSRQSIPVGDRSALALAATDRALKLPQVRSATHVLGFAATPEELDPAPLLQALRALGATICLPRISGPSVLSIHTCGENEPLEDGPFGLRQPLCDAAAADTSAIDLIIVPGVAFDARGARLGFGGGYYDRLLSRIPQAARVALSFDVQIVAKVPEGDHDQRVDVVVTPSRTLTGARRR